MYLWPSCSQSKKLEIEVTLRPLHSVLDISESNDSTIQLFHVSFRDFLLDKDRCHEKFWIDEKRTHGDLAESCLQVMSNALRRDICGLQLPGTLISEVQESRVRDSLPIDVQYACRYWVQHLQNSSINLRDDDSVHIFLQTHFLHWLEALSLMRAIPKGVLMVTVSNLVSIISFLNTDLSR
jgi:hypothetical protein